MFNEIKWILPHKLLVQRIWGQFDPVMLKDCSAQLVAYVAEARQHKEDHILMVFDLSALEINEKYFQAHRKLELLAQVDRRLRLTKRGFIIIVTGQEQASLLVTIFSQIFLQPMTTTDSIEEALKIIKHMYPKLRDSLDAEQG